jgi:Phosphatidylinositol-specific phospholipase C, X domain
MSAPAKPETVMLSSPKPPGTVSTFEHSIMDALQSFHKRIAKEALPEVQKELAKSDFASFLQYMGSKASDALTLPPSSNYNLPLSCYFIATSHNTYLTGNQLIGKATVDGYKNVSIPPKSDF